MSDDATIDYPEDAGAGGAAAAPIKIGRYQLLELVGTGGMGMVWGAWDPELERRVALKLVRLASRASRERMLREGQVLARFSHPNVVPIFDVGALDDQIYLVMEWVRGTTLRAFAASAPGPRAIVEAYRQAGLGLEAAHRAGVVHRDFKPDNAIRGDDGRVRVLDFGLARDGGDDAGTAAGTPRYMPPEQVRGAPATAASDQFAFCRSLGEALGDAPPAWLAAIVARGTAEDPARRFPSMASLLAALDRDPARRRRRIALAAAAVLAATAAAGVAFAVGRSGTGAIPVETCTGAAAELAPSWSPAVRDRVIAHLGSLGAPVTPAQIAGLAGRLDAYAGAWIDEHRSACRARERRELTPAADEARLACLSRARSQLGGIGELLAGAATAVELANAERAAGQLPDVRGCAQAEPITPPPADQAAAVAEIAARVERLLVRIVAGQGDTTADAATITEAAYRTGYRPLVARALLVQGRGAIDAYDPLGRDVLSQAWRIALAERDEPLAVEAYARWLFARLRLRGAVSPPAASWPPMALAAAVLAGDPPVTAEMWPVVGVLAERLDDRDRFARALLYNNAALPYLIAGDRDRARALLERAWRAAGERPAVELISILENLARLEPESAACERQLRRALALRAAAFAPNHPDLLVTKRNIALLVRDRDAALAMVREACTGLASWQQDAESRYCAYDAGWIADALGATDEARAWMVRAAALPAPDGPIATAYGAVMDDRVPPAERAAILDAVARIAATPPAEWLERLPAADALAVLARAAERAGDARATTAAWARAVELLEGVPFPHYHRRVARAQRELALRWAATRPADAAAVAARALTWYGTATGEEATAAALAQIRGTAPGSR